jgi:pyrroline-5-carboxylate reductase
MAPGSAKKRFGIIGGNGWLGNAMADAAVASGFLEASQLTLSARSDRRGRVEIPGAYWTRDNAELAARSDVIVLSVRPDQLDGVSIDARGKLVVSVMAGVPSRRIAERTGSARVIRTMPNAAATLRKSFTPWFAAAEAAAEDGALIQRFLETFGDAAPVGREEHLDYCAGLTGSGAAFPALLAQAMIEHAVAQGLPADFARRAVAGVVVEAAQLLSGREPGEIVEELVAYRGTTTAAIDAMVEAGFVRAVHAGLAAAAGKSAAMAGR